MLLQQVSLGSGGGGGGGNGGGATVGEKELVAQLRRGEARACNPCVRDHTGVALSVARRILGNEADAFDAVQDAFLSFFRSLPGFQEGSKLSTWLHRIVVNAALMKLRSRVRRHEKSMDDLLPQYYPDGHRIDPRPAWQPSVPELMQRQEIRALVRRKIDELPEEFRNVLLLRDIEELDTAQTAELLQDTPGAVKTRLHRARQALRGLLEKELLV
jgi:RNA polymerase sigma-70 factor (ECF subfamily)